MKRLAGHNLSKGCSFLNLTIESEDQLGLNSIVTVKCNNCPTKFKISLTDPTTKTYDLNASLFAEPVVAQLGQAGVNKLLESVDLPSIPPGQFNYFKSVAETKQDNEIYIKEEIDFVEENFFKEDL